jgi:hypothetical protein
LTPTPEGRIVGQPGTEELVVGITDAQSEQHPIGTAFVEPFGASEEQLADPIQRVRLAAAMTEGLVLHPPPDLIDAAVGDPHDVKRIGDAAGVIEMRRQSGAERLGQIRRHHGDPAEPRRVSVLGPAPQVIGAVAFHHVDHDVTPEVDQAGRVDRRMLPVGGQERRLVDPQLRHSADSIRVVDERGACSMTAFMIVHQHTPSSSANWATGRAFSPTWRHASMPARRVSTACAST